MTQPDLISVPPHNGNPDANARYTIRRAIAWCKATAGVSEYDLDVAACEEAHHARLWYGVAENGLSLPWFGHVFCKRWLLFVRYEPRLERELGATGRRSDHARAKEHHWPKGAPP